MPTKKLLLLSSVAIAALSIAVGWKLSHRSVGTPGVPQEVGTAGPRKAVPLQVAETIYDGKLTPGWQDWGWGPHDLSPNGPAKVVFGGFGGVIFHHGAVEANFGALAFRYKAPEGWPYFLAVTLKSSRSDGKRLPSVTVQEAHVAMLPDGWSEVLIPLSELNPDRIAFE